MKTIFARPAFREASLVFLIVLVSFGYFSSERDVNINSRLALVKAAVDEGRLEIDSFHNAELYTNDKAFFNGHYYSDKAIGASVLGIAAYYPVRWVYYQMGIRLTPRLFREWVTFLAVSLPAALLAPFLYLLVKSLARERWIAILITLGICLGTPFYKYATAFYGHALAGALYFLAFAIWFDFRRGSPITLPLVFLSGFLMGFTFITEYPGGVLLVTLALYVLFHLRQSNQFSNWRIYFALLLGAAIPVGVLGIYNTSIFGTPLAAGYLHEADETFRAAHASSFMGIGWPDLRVFYYQTLHPSLGIFWQSPILFLSLIGMVFMARKKEYRLELVFCAGSILLFIAVISGYYMWWGGVAFTPRHLVPILPLFAIPLAFLPARFSIPLVLTAGLSILQNLLITASSEVGLAAYLESTIQGNQIPSYKGSVIYQICLPNVLNGEMINNRGNQFFLLEGASSLLPLVIMEILMLGFFFKNKGSSTGG